MRFIFLLLLSIIFVSAEGIVLPENFTASFKQIVTNPKKKVLTYTGKIAFSDKTDLKWSYKNPALKEVCVSGHQMVLVDHDLEQVSYLVIEDSFDFLTVLKSAKKHHKNVYTSKYKEQVYTLKLNTKGQIESVAYYDNLDNKVQLVFTHLHYGKGSLSPKQMQCVVPSGYDEIK